VDDLVTAISDRAATATLRTGRVVGLTGAALTIDVGGGQYVDMPYLTAYVPILGDTVQILQQAGVNVVLDSLGGMPSDNVVYNPSFEVDSAGSTSITGWSKYTDPASTGTTTVKVDTATGWGPKDGTQWLELNHQTAGFVATHMYSALIQVQAGQRWSACAYCVSANEAGVDEPVMEVALAFHGGDTAYPADIVSTSTIQAINGPTGPQWVPVRAVTGNGVTVPFGASTMRVVLVTEEQGGSVYWDKVICRRVDA
jgi:hypothetical protein